MTTHTQLPEPMAPSPGPPEPPSTPGGDLGGGPGGPSGPSGKSGTADAPRSGDARRSRIGFGRVLLTAAHLAALGFLGTIVFAFLITLLTAGLGLLVVFGIGLVMLVGLVYALYGVGWFEIERVRGVYGFEIASLRMRPRQAPGFAGWLRSIGRQSIDGRMWSALVSFGIGSLLGLIVMRLIATAAWSLGLLTGGDSVATGPWALFGPELEILDPTSVLSAFASPLWSLLAAVLALAAIIGLAALHAVIARALLGPTSRAALAAEVRTKSAQREGAVRAADLERTRIERDLHDGVQPRLVSIGMTLGLAQQKIDEDPATAKELISEAHTSTKAAITELRQLARGIHASVLDDRGLDAALSALAGRSHIPVLLDVRMDGATSLRESGGAFREAEAAVYFSIAEALTNAAKHSRAAECRVTVRLRDASTPQAVLWARAEDNGIGGATVQPGGGLDGISNRVLAARGQFRIDSPQGGPTALEVSFPCAF